MVFIVFFYDAHITVDPTPANATVSINGQTVTARTAIKLAPGNYTLRVAADGYLPTQENISLRVSDRRQIPITLRQIPSPIPFVGSVQYPALTAGGQAIVYLGLNGQQFSRVNTTLGADGKPVVQAISDPRFNNITNVVWSPDQSLAVIQTSDGSTQLFDFKRYDFVSQELRPIGTDLRSIVWSPDGQSLVAFESTPAGDRSLIRWNVSTGQSERLVDLRSLQLTNPTLAWSPDGRWISLTENNLFLYDTTTRTVQQVSGTTKISAASWSPDSKHILLATPNGLALANPTPTSSMQTLGVRTSIDKTVWTADSQAIIAATSASNGQDHLTRIDITTVKQADYLYSNPNPVVVNNPIVTKDGSTLWFTNRGTLTSLLLELDQAGSASK